MVHEPHGFSASMIATGREPTLPPDLEGEACASHSLEDPVAYVGIVKQRLALTHQQMDPPPAPVAINPYHEGSLIFVMTTPPERSSKLAPRWKGPFFVKRVPAKHRIFHYIKMLVPLCTPDSSACPLGNAKMQSKPSRTWSTCASLLCMVKKANGSW